jgi:hypothetical protein
VKDLAQAVARLVPSTAIEINPNAVPDKRSYQVDFGLYRELAPAHQPQHSLDDSVALLIKGLTDMAFSDTNFRESQLMRLKVLNALRARGALNEHLQWTEPREALPLAAAGH